MARHIKWNLVKPLFISDLFILLYNSLFVWIKLTLYKIKPFSIVHWQLRLTKAVQNIIKSLSPNLSQQRRPIPRTAPNVRSIMSIKSYNNKLLIIYSATKILSFTPKRTVKIKVVGKRFLRNEFINTRMTETWTRRKFALRIYSSSRCSENCNITSDTASQITSPIRYFRRHNSSSLVRI